MVMEEKAWRPKMAENSLPPSKPNYKYYTIKTQVLKNQNETTTRRNKGRCSERKKKKVINHNLKVDFA